MQRPLTVTELNRQVRQLLENSFMQVLVTGEISNFSCPASGHWYFTLKDAQSQVRCAMFRNRNLGIRPPPRNGDEVTLTARVSLYEGRGEFQLIADQMERAGEGALRRAYEALRLRLQDEGLFDPARKRPLPTLPRRIGIVTSPTGAVIRDMLTVLGRRFPAIPVLLAPVPVQGSEAAPALVRAIERLNRHQLCDLIIVGRGGGSLEDLWAFNEEIVVRAVVASAIPVISAVGHETDTTLTDFAADWRAPTPSAAAERASPDRLEWLQRLRLLERRSEIALSRSLQGHARHLAHWEERLPAWPRQLQQRTLRLDEWRGRLDLALRRCLEGKRRTLMDQQGRLKHPRTRLAEAAVRRQALLERLHYGIGRLLQGRRDQLERRTTVLPRLGEQLPATATHRLQALAGKLTAVSPLATLARGYSITQTDTGQVVTRGDQVQVGGRLRTRLQQGELVSVIEAIR